MYTHVIHIDPQFRPTKPQTLPPRDTALEITKFPGGEVNVRIGVNPRERIGDSAYLLLTMRYRNDADLVLLLLVVDAARNIGFNNINLLIPYFPGARQDRVCNFGEALTVKVFANLINALGFRRVFIMTPHSDVTPALLNNVVVLPDYSMIADACMKMDKDAPEMVIVSPDAGAHKRVSKVITYISSMLPAKRFQMCKCDKTRDVATGALSAFSTDATDLKGVPTLVVDDIVAYGGTFVGVAEVLRSANCGPLGIFVTHADCYAGLVKLSETYDFVFTTNSRCIALPEGEQLPTNVTVFNNTLP